MKVRAKYLKDVEVELSDFTIREIVLENFCKIFDMPENSYIKDGKLMHNVEYYTYTSNSWYESKEIREASEEDIMANYILKKLKKNL